MNDITSPASRPPEKHVPLVVDVDGTLVATDLLQEAALQFVARRPLQSAYLAGWLMRGKRHLKAELADRVNPGVGSVPLREEVLALIREAQTGGRPVYLASASDRRYIEELADRVGGLAGVFATDQAEGNLAGQAKADRLVREFGVGGYDYVGDQAVDFPVWRSARKVLAVAHSDGFAARVMKTFPGAAIIARPRPAPRSYLRALRPHQWAKNVLVFLPAVAGHHFGLDMVAATLLAFVCFSLAASSSYLVNDLLDLPGDRDHPRKARRPFAAGEVPVTHGVVLAALLMIAALALSFLLPSEFIFVLAVYVAMTFGYSFFLKRKVLIDVIILGGLYTIRVYGGLAATHLQQTQWLLMFSLFLFLCLAIVKRCSELVDKRAAGKTDVLGRGYIVGDLATLLPLGATAGYGAVLVFSLYLSSPEVAALYQRPERMWLVCPLLLYWVSRVLLMSNRGDLHDDPVVFALTDRTSWLTGLCVAAVIVASI